MQIGEVPWVGEGESYRLSHELKEYLNNKGYFVLVDVWQMGILLNGF
jgi:hypothetical protein